MDNLLKVKSNKLFEYYKSKIINKRDNLYLIKFVLNAREISITCSEEKFDSIINWYKSTENEYTIETDNRYLRISKNNLTELSYFRISKFRQFAEPLIYILKGPVNFDLKSYINMLISFSILICIYMYSKGIPFTNFFIANSNEYAFLIDFKDLINCIIIVFYSIYVCKKLLELKNHSELNTYVKTMEYNWKYSFIFNTIAIFFMSYAVSNLLVLFN